MPERRPDWIELVHVRAADGVRLDGALSPPQTADGISLPAVPSLADAAVIICLHGTGSNFYSARLLTELTRPFCLAGYWVLRGNTRGHDLAFPIDSARLGGSSYETVADCQHDIAAWMDWLDHQGVARILLLGHSLGGVKVLFAAARGLAPRLLERVIAVSPPRLAASFFAAGSRADEFQTDLTRAAALVDLGQQDTLLPIRFPMPYLLTAAGYLDKYGPQSRYDLLELVPQIPCPTLITYGARELRPGTAFFQVPEALQALGAAAPQLTCAVIAEADHQYTSVAADLAASILRWIGVG